MRTKEAVAQRILELCRERNIAVNALQIFQAFRRQPSTVCSTKRARIRAWCRSRNSATVLKSPFDNSLTVRCLMKLNKR